MRDEPTDANPPISNSRSGVIDEVCTRFEAAWRAGQAPRIGDFLPPDSPDIDAALRRELFEVLAAIDREWREAGKGDSPIFADTKIGTVPEKAGENVKGQEMQFPGLEILEEIAPGQGGMGMVFRARDVHLDKIVAVKTPKTRQLSGEGRDYFVREAQNAARLDHPNIVKIFRLEPDHAPPYYVMEYVAGRPLDEACRGRSAEHIAALLEQTARALAFAHRKGVVHRDIKPGNILVDFEEGRPHITDFGLAERWGTVGVVEGDSTNFADTKIGSVPLHGTAAFIAPEIYEGAAQPGPAVDLFALGVTMYLLLTGRNPFQASTLAGVRGLVLDGAVPLPKEISPETPEPLQRICLKLLERDPSARYETADRVADDLRRFLDGREVLARPTRYDSELRGKLQNHRAEIHAWREQNLIRTPEMDSLLRPYARLLEAESPWTALSQRFPLETIGIRLGGCLVLLSSLLWPLFYWPDLDAFQRVLSVGCPTVLLNAAGWFFHRLHVKWNARVFWGIGALLLPLLVVVVLTQYRWLEFRQDAARELGAWFEAQGHEFVPTNMQGTIAAGAFVAYCAVLLRACGARLFVVWLGVGAYVLFSGILLLAGMKEWIVGRHVARSILWYSPMCAIFLFTAMAWNARGRRRDAAALYVFFPVPLAALLTALGWYGGTEWFDANEPLRQNQTVNGWWMANGAAYALAAALGLSARTGFFRFWGEFFLLLVPVSFLVPTNLLFREGAALGVLGGQPLTVYELSGLLLAVGFVVLGTILMRSSLALPGTIGLTVFVFRMTDLHFARQLEWPLALAVSGAAAMSAGVLSSWLRDRINRRIFSRQNSDKTGLGL